MLGFEWLFRGLELFKFLAACQLVAKAVSLLCMILFIHSREQLPLYAVLSVLTAHGSDVICFFTARKYVDLSFRFNTSHFKSLFIFFLMACAGTIYSSLDLTMLGFMKSDLETGLYSVAAKGRSGDRFIFSCGEGNKCTDSGKRCCVDVHSSKGDKAMERRKERSF